MLRHTVHQGGAAGDDDAQGNFGADTVLGGRGNDTLSGGEGFDYIEGNDGDDILMGTRTSEFAQFSHLDKIKAHPTFLR